MIDETIDTTAEHVPPRRFWKPFFIWLGGTFVAYIMLHYGRQETDSVFKILTFSLRSGRAYPGYADVRKTVIVRIY